MELTKNGGGSGLVGSPPTRLLTAQSLRSLGAYEPAVLDFQDRYPSGLNLDGECPEMLFYGLIYWFVHLLPPNKLVEFERGRTTALITLKRILDAAWFASKCAPGHMTDHYLHIRNQAMADYYRLNLKNLWPILTTSWQDIGQQDSKK